MSTDIPAQEDYSSPINMDYFLNSEPNENKAARPQASNQLYQSYENSPCPSNTYNAQIAPTTVAAVLPAVAPVISQFPTTAINQQILYHKVATQAYTSIEKKCKAEIAVINAQARVRKEEEARNAVANECQIMPSNGQLYAYTNGKIFKPVLSHIPEVYRIDPADRYSILPYYLLYFPDLKQCCCVSVPDLSKPEKLENALANWATDVQLFVFGKERTRVLKGLAEYFLHNAQPHFYPYFLGWKCYKGQFRFSLLDSTTHSPALPDLPDQIKVPELFQQKSPAEAIIAVQQAATFFRNIENKNIRQLLFIWWHISFLYSLLAKCKYAPSIGLSIDCPNFQIYRAMESLLGWYSDPPISLAEETALFQSLLPERKDQPLLVVCQAPNARNEAILLNMLRNHTIPAPDFYEPLRQQAPLTILIKGRECLIRDPSLLDVELSPADFANIRDFSCSPALWHDYFRGFAHFTANRTAKLCDILNSISYPADLNSDDSLSYQGEEFLMLYSGIRKYLQYYLTSLDPTGAAVADALALLEEDSSYLVELIERSSASRYYDCERFLWAAQKVLETGIIHLVDALRPISCVSKDDPTVFYDQDYCYFNLPAFRMIAAETGISSRELIASLKDANLLMGPFVNTASAQTRLPTKYLVGKENVRVYKLLQSRIDDGRGAKSFFRR